MPPSMFVGNISLPISLSDSGQLQFPSPAKMPPPPAPHTCIVLHSRTPANPPQLCNCKYN